MKRKEKMFRFWVDILFKIIVFVAFVIAMKLIFFK